MRRMDQVEFRLEERELGIGRQPCVELIVNGQNLTTGYAGLQPDLVFADASRFLDHPDAEADAEDPAYEHPDSEEHRRAFILRCGCGDAGCSFVLAKIRVLPDRVVWSDFYGSGPRGSGSRTLGPFTFDRAEYEQALRQPR